ncbi:MAG: hypothetical protein IH908_09790, partial [Proteobacteria bacterium]|nr:hypothetical protein [Pseudomonadota bacterium]
WSKSREVGGLSRKLVVDDPRHLLHRDGHDVKPPLVLHRDDGKHTLAQLSKQCRLSGTSGVTPARLEQLTNLRQWVGIWFVRPEWLTRGVFEVTDCTATRRLSAFPGEGYFSRRRSRH